LAAEIEYKESVFKDLKNIGSPHAKRIVEKLEEQLKKNPNKGLPLKGEFEGLFKLRVGEYRVIYAKTTIGVLVLCIAHRKKAYK
jgi:mRNA interferase RelE/StbE